MEKTLLKLLLPSTLTVGHMGRKKRLMIASSLDLAFKS